MSDPRASYQGTLLSKAQLDLHNIHSQALTAPRVADQAQLAIINWRHPKKYISEAHEAPAAPHKSNHECWKVRPQPITPDSAIPKRWQPGDTHLPEFTQRGEFGQWRQLDVGHAEKLQLLKRVIEPFDFPVAGPAVVEHQLCHLWRRHVWVSQQQIPTPGTGQGLLLWGFI